MSSKAALSSQMPRILSAEPLKKVCDGVYTVDSSLQMFKTMALHNRMTVLVLPDGELLVYSPLPPELVDTDALRSLGVVKYVVAPNSMHKSFARSFAAGECFSRTGSST
jgi:hypothetical protein